MPRITAVHPVLPAHRHEQADIAEALVGLMTSGPGEAELLRRVHAACGVRTRHLARPLADYTRRSGFDAAQQAYPELATGLGVRALEGALDRAGVGPADVGLLLFTTVTGVGAPSVDATVAARAGLTPHVLRWPSFGLGCAAGAGGLALAADWARSRPDGVAVVLAVELCSLTVRTEHPERADVVAAGLFGDGAAAAVVVGDDRAAGHPGHDVLAARSHLYPEETAALGFELSAAGFRIVLSPRMPGLVRDRLAPDLAAWLRDRGEDVPADWVVHSGGPAVIDAYEDGLGLARGRLDPSRQTLAEVGNLSSAAVLHTLAAGWDRPHGSGDRTVLAAVGPGISAQSLVLGWSAS
ncbi:type III polyketide synthase [Kineococcus gynurae]|uniref:Type III polyketide synthase n=1 Tax=Kineococcus gynurae TaxID=452979 RepID=A0ABV5LQV1_9ACTN